MADIEKYHKSGEQGGNVRFANVGRMVDDIDEATGAVIGKKREYAGIGLKIKVEATQPVIIASEDVIKKSTRGSVKNKTFGTLSKALADGTFCLYDDYYESLNPGVGRFIFITESISPLTRSGTAFFYDRMYNDVIITPELTSLYNPDGLNIQNVLITVTGSRLGGDGSVGDFRALDNFIPLGTTSNNCYFPETNTDLDTETYFMVLNGCDQDTSFKHIDFYDTIENATGDFNGAMRGELMPTSMLCLGTARELFVKDKVEIPLYLMHKFAPERYSLVNIGRMDPLDRKLYCVFGM